MILCFTTHFLKNLHASFFIFNLNPYLCPRSVSLLRACGSKLCGKRTLRNVIFYGQTSQICTFSEDTATGTSALGVLYPIDCTMIVCFVWVYNMSRRGLTALLILRERQCEGLTVGQAESGESHVFFISITNQLNLGEVYRL